MTPNPDLFLAALSRARARLTARRALGWAVRAAWVGAAAAACVYLAGFYAAPAAALAPWVLPAVPVAALVAASTALCFRPSLAVCAAWVDRACGLEERAATAYERLETRLASPGDRRRGASRTEAMDAVLVSDAADALTRADLDRLTRLAVPREAPILGAALAAAVILLLVPGQPPAGAGPSADPARVALRKAGRALDGALRDAPAGAAWDTVRQEIKTLAEDLRAGRISAAEAEARLGELRRAIETRLDRAAGRPDAGRKGETESLRAMLEGVSSAELLAAEAATASGGSAAAVPEGAGEEPLRALEEGFRRGFASPPRGDAAPSGQTPDFPAAEAPPATPTAPGKTSEPAAADAGRPSAADLKKILAAQRRALVERNWPRWRYDAVIDRYFGIREPRRMPP